MKTNKAYYIALYAIMFAAIFVAMMLDKAISFIGLPISLAVCVLLVTFSFAFIKNEWHIALFSGVFFGIASLLKEFIFPPNAALNPYGALLFTNYPYLLPLQYVLPRLFVGIAAFLMYKLFLILTKNSKMSARTRQILCISLGVFVGLLVNTVLFFTAMIIIKQELAVATGGLWAYIVAVFFTNIITEYPIAIILTPLIVLGVRKGLHLGIEALPLSEED